MKKEKEEPMVRVNTRIRKSQHKFIKAWAKKKKMTEGEMTRLIIDTFMVSNSTLIINPK